MNNVVLIGRLTKDVELRYTDGAEPKAIARFTLAVNRMGKKDEADFINCLAFGRTAEFMEKYTGKGKLTAINGRIHTGSYTNKEGKTVYTTNVIADLVHPCEWKERTDNGLPEGFEEVDTEELPF